MTGNPVGLAATEFDEAAYRLDCAAESAGVALARLRDQIEQWHLLVSQGVVAGYYDRPADVG